MSERIKGVIFDLGDTLLDFGKVDVTALFEAGGRLTYGYMEDHGFAMPPFGVYYRRQLRAIRWSYFKSRVTRREFNSMDLIGRLAMKMGHELSPDQKGELAWLWYEPLSRCAKVEPGLADLLRRLHADKLVVGVVSNTFVPGANLDRHLAAEGLLDLLPIRIYSCDVGYRKPNPKIFRLALERCGLAAGQTLFVGDSIKADIGGANKAGLISVLKDPSGRFARNRIKPVHRISTLAELPGVVAQYNG